MQPLQATDLLRFWETGSGSPPLERALAVLSAHSPEAGWQDLADRPVGQHNIALLELRKAMFGPHLGSVVDCPACGTTLGLDLAIPDLLAAAQAADLPALVAGRRGGGGPALFDMEVGPYHLTYRLLTSADLGAVASAGGQREARLELIERCVVQATRQRRDDRLVAVKPSALPASVVAALAEALNGADPLADLPINLTCADCGYGWAPPLDPGALLWAELSACALQTLQEVHTLAAAYGWHEADILAMSPIRRQAYLERVAGG